MLKIQQSQTVGQEIVRIEYADIAQPPVLDVSGQGKVLSLQAKGT